MKKKNIVTLFIILMILFIKTNVNAADACTSADLSVYRMEANNVNIMYELSPKDPEITERTLSYYDLIISNVTNNIDFKIKDYNFYGKENVDGEMKINKIFSGGGFNAKIEIYTSSATKCAGRTLKTVTLTIPYYNRFSTRKECKGYEELQICRINSNTDNIEDEQFTEIFTKQKKEYEKKPKKDNPVVAWFNKNKKEILTAVTVIVGVVVLMFIIKLIIDRKKVKVKLGGRIE